MWGALEAGLLVTVTLLLLTVTTIGTSPAPASEAGSLKFMMSEPGNSLFGPTKTISAPVIAVVPTVTVTSAGRTDLTPVTDSSITVATVLPLASGDVTLNGSGVLLPGLVTFMAMARPSASFVDEKISGCDTTRGTNPRKIVSLPAPASKILTVTLPTPSASEIGTTKLICFEALLTKCKPAAAPLTDTDTPFNSIGKAGLRVVSEKPPAVASEGASATVDRTILSSPGASPIPLPGAGLGTGVGDGVGVGDALGVGVGVAFGTGILLAPVKNDNAADDSAVTMGVNM